MRIDPKDALAGQPILKIRDFLRNCQLFNWNTQTVITAFNVDLGGAERIIVTLKQRGYVRSVDISGRKYWKTTLKGNALALSSAAKPLLRATAERKLREFLDRVVEVRKSKYYLYKVSEVVVFGSYLSGNEKINDIDLSINLLPKEKNEQRRRRREEDRVSDAIYYKRVSRDTAIMWPQLEVIRFLKGRSRGISLHIDEEIVKHCEHQIIYRDE
jgi:predicted nucleotidyltransferase/predicted transcriptional regulator